MSKSLLEEIEQTKGLFTQDFNKRCACVMRRNYYALEASSIKESFDSDVFDFYEDKKYDSVERPKSHFTFSALSIDETFINGDESPLSLDSTKNQSSDQEENSLDSVIERFSYTNRKIEESLFQKNDKNNNSNGDGDDYEKISNLLKKYRASSKQRLICHRNSIEQLREVQSKVKEINDLDYNVNSLIFKAVEVHTDILVMDTTVTRLLSETRQLLDELEDVKYLDDLIEILNQDIGPVIHREWKYSPTKCDGPIEEGIAVT